MPPRKPRPPGQVPAFLQILRQNYGSITSGWRNVLDPIDKGTCGRAHFINVARKLGYSGDIKHLWSTLDDDLSMFITLDELDKKAYHEMTTSRSFARTGSVLHFK